MFTLKIKPPTLPTIRKGGIEFLVRNLDDKEQAAKLLSIFVQDYLKLVDHFTQRQR